MFRNKHLFKVENPEGKRIQDFFVNGKRLNKSKTYSACFVTAQGVPESSFFTFYSSNMASFFD